MSKKLSPVPIDDKTFTISWYNWLTRLREFLTTVSGIAWDTIDKDGSNLTDIETRNHNDLKNINGGTTNQYYHLNQSQYIDLTDGGSSSAHYHTHIGNTSNTNASVSTYYTEGAVLINGILAVNAVSSGTEKSWMETLSPATAQCGQFVSIADTSRWFGGVFGARSSDAPSTPSYTMGTCTVVYTDRTSGSVYTIGQYIENHIAITGSTPGAEGIEIGMINNNSTLAVATPYNPHPSGVTRGLAVGSGKPSSGTNKTCSNAIGIYNINYSGDSNFNVGILFDDKSLKLTGDRGSAIQMAKGHQIEWYNSNGLGPIITSDCSNTGEGMRVVFGDNTFNIQDNSGASNLVTVTNAGNLTCVGTIEMDDLRINTGTATTAGTSAGYITVNIDGTDYKIQIYNT